MITLLQFLNYATTLFFILLGSISGVLIRNLWLIQKKKLVKFEFLNNVIASVASIFFTLIIKYFISKESTWTVDVYAGASFMVGLVASVVLDLFTDPSFIKKTLFRKIEEKNENIDVKIEGQNDTENKDDVSKEHTKE